MYEVLGILTKLYIFTLEIVPKKALKLRYPHSIFHVTWLIMWLISINITCNDAKFYVLPLL